MWWGVSPHHTAGFPLPALRSRPHLWVCLGLVVCTLVAAQPQTDPEISLRDLAKAGDLTTVEQILSQGANPDADESADPPPLWEAANNSDTAMVALFLQEDGPARSPHSGGGVWHTQFRANHSLSDPATLTTPLHVAVSKNSEGVVRLLLAHGANPSLPDRKGLTATRAAQSAEDSVRILFHIWETHGPMGLEDPPGTWHRFDEKDNDMPFYFNPITQEARWMKPPSCSWRRTKVGGANVYVNDVTHQTSWIMPPALCWKKVDIKGTEAFWLNFKTNVTSVKVPAELPDDLALELESHPRQYWFNVVTGVSQWNDPKENSWNELQDDTGRKYWFNPSSGDSTYQRPDEMAWREIESKEHGRTFYFNDLTAEATWIKPPSLGWIQHDEL